MLLDAILIGLGAVLAGLVYLTSRHVGALIMSVCAGLLLASLTANSLTNWLIEHGLNVRVDPHALVTVALCLLPPLVIWYGSPKQRYRLGRMLGAMIFGLVVIAVLVPSIPDIVASSQNETIVSRTDTLLMQFRTVIISMGVIYATFDLLVAHRHAAKALHGQR